MRVSTKLQNSYIIHKSQPSPVETVAAGGVICSVLDGFGLPRSRRLMPFLPSCVRCSAERTPSLAVGSGSRHRHRHRHRQVPPSQFLVPPPPSPLAHKRGAKPVFAAHCNCTRVRDRIEDDETWEILFGKRMLVVQKLERFWTGVRDSVTL